MLASDSKKDAHCACDVLEQPDLWHKELTARWMVHSLDWGVLTTISSRLPGNLPFGNVYSFVDGPCDYSTGTPYFYGTYMDQSFLDMKSNPSASFTLSEASFATVCGGEALPACMISHHRHGDPESPVCARLTLTGKLVEVPKDSDEYKMARDALFHRHQQMTYWPEDHEWVIAKLEIDDIWFIDYFGGPSVLDLDKYRLAEPIPDDVLRGND